MRSVEGLMGDLERNESVWGGRRRKGREDGLDGDHVTWLIT